MATESEQCVDFLYSQLNRIEQLASKLADKTLDHQPLTNEAREILSSTQLYIDNNKSLVPGYCLKRVADGLRTLECRINEPQKEKLQFKFKSSTPKVSAATQPADGAPPSSHIRSSIVEQAHFGFKNQSRAQLALTPEQVESKDISLINLDACQVNVDGLSNTVYIDRLRYSQVTIYLACRAIKITNCTNCYFNLICQQLRIESTTRSEFDVYSSTGPMLESSNNLIFKRLLIDDADVKTRMERAQFKIEENSWDVINDFDWLVPNVPSKNYTLLTS